jgi:hypothetical protein
MINRMLFIQGTLVGITNSLGTIPGFVAPLVVGAITNHNVRDSCEIENEKIVNSVTYLSSKQSQHGDSYSTFQLVLARLAVLPIVFYSKVTNNHGIEFMKRMIEVTQEHL